MSQDRKLQELVLAEFQWEPSVNAAHVGVTARAGVVTLSGTVDSFAKKHAATATERRVKGVKAIADEIEVQLPFDAHRTDEQIAAAAIKRLSWNVSVPKDSVQVSVKNGHVTLTGEAEQWYQKDAAEKDIQPLHGVVSVLNHMTIRPRVNTNYLGDDIIHALHRSWFFDAETTHVRADGSRVVLSGTVHSLHEREIAAQIAWSAPGVTSVENDLVVA